MNRATYNITSNRLKVWFAERLPKDEYEAAKRIGFVYWFGSKCLTCAWRPAAEDFILARGIEIEEDDRPDDTEARVERFDGYATDAERNAASSESYLNTRANTERRRRNALNGAMSETERAAYWQGRIERSIRHAAFKERPDVIARRIAELETDLRRHVASFTPHTNKAGEVMRYGSQVIVGPKGGRGGHAVEESSLPARKAAAQRWVDHIENRLIYERAALAAAGGIQADFAAPGGVAIEVGGAVKAPRWCRDGWLEVLKVNKKTVSIYDPFCDWCHYRNLNFTEITETATKLRVDSGDIHFPTRAPQAAKEKATKATTNRQGDPLEKFGAFGSSGSFHDDRAKPVERWHLITRVNAKTVEYLSKHVEQVQSGDGKVTPRTRYFLKKTEIYGMGRAISAAMVAAEHPELLADWEAVQAIQKRNAERKAAAEAVKESAA
jgi:hypothetical protein